MRVKVARVAVSAAAPYFDKPFAYLASPKYEDVLPGDRVLVQFSKGRKPVAGFVFSTEEWKEEDTSTLKPVLFKYDRDIALSKEDISLALWMRQRYFCTFFDCANAMIPPGSWSKTKELFFLPDNKIIKLTSGVVERAVIDALSDCSDRGMTISEIENAAKIENLENLIHEMVSKGFLEKKRVISGKDVRRTINTLVSAKSPDEVDEKEFGRGEAALRRRRIFEFVNKIAGTPEAEVLYQTGGSSADVRFLLNHKIIDRVEIPRYLSYSSESAEQSSIVLSDQQKKVYDGIEAMAERGSGCALLYGVTGSGKTAVYIQLIRACLERGKSAIIMVPEIALTPQMFRQFRACFGDNVAIIHSGLDPSRRYEEYMRIKTGLVKVVLGTRSAVFSPIDNLGIVIVDEEHETSYRSESSPRYNAIEVAKVRCSRSNCLLLLGSATPSVESYYYALHGNYTMFTLRERYNSSTLPKTVIADMKEEIRDGNNRAIGRVLRLELENTLANRNQAILFINRRGSARMAICSDCGYIPQCKNCSIPLTYHSANNRLMCHHCNYSIPFINRCPNCGGTHIKLVGSGTQKIEQEISELFPDASILRMDSDTTIGRKSHEEILDSFFQGNADILLGTQMVAKGLDFPNVTLVGVVDADASLYSGSYNAEERGFSLISQVIGRAGRREKIGRAVIQSYMPDNPVIIAASKQDYEEFYTQEIQTREIIGAPPFQDIFTFFLSGYDATRVRLAAEKLASGLEKALHGKYKNIYSPILGPSPAVIFKLNNKYRYVVTYKGKNNRDSRQLIWDILSWFSSQSQFRSISVSADCNAYYF